MSFRQRGMAQPFTSKLPELQAEASGAAESFRQLREQLSAAPVRTPVHFQAVQAPGEAVEAVAKLLQLRLNLPAAPNGTAVRTAAVSSFDGSSRSFGTLLPLRVKCATARNGTPVPIDAARRVRGRCSPLLDTAMGRRGPASMPTRLHRVAPRRGCPAELVSSFDAGRDGSVPRGGEILRGLGGDPGRRKLGVRSPQSSGRLDAVAEGRAREQGVEADLGHPHRGLGSREPLRGVAQDLDVRRLARQAHTMARIGHARKASEPHSPTVPFAGMAPLGRRGAQHDRQIVGDYQARSITRANRW